MDSWSYVDCGESEDGTEGQGQFGRPAADDIASLFVLARSGLVLMI
jgi:hypothetical protein